MNKNEITEAKNPAGKGNINLKIQWGLLPDESTDEIANIKKKWNVKIKPSSDLSTAMVSGKKSDIYDYLVDPEYWLEPEDIIDMYPELLETKEMKEMNEALSDLLGHILSGNKIDAKAIYNSELKSKITNALEMRRPSVAAEMFGKLTTEAVVTDKFSKGDKVTVINAKSYDALRPNKVSGVVKGMNGPKVMVSVGTGSMNVDPKDLIKD